MLGPLPSENLRNLRPPLAFLQHRPNQRNILAHAPLLFVDVGVEMVDPLLAALLRRSHEASVGAHEELQGDLSPFALCVLAG